MRWTWPAWLAVVLGAILLAMGLYHGVKDHLWTDFAGVLAGGAILLGLGLHALQGSYDAWSGCCCDDGCEGGCCGPDGCGCDHCADCSDGDCCGNCACTHGDGSSADEGHSHQH